MKARHACSSFCPPSFPDVTASRERRPPRARRGANHRACMHLLVRSARLAVQHQRTYARPSRPCAPAGAAQPRSGMPRAPRARARALLTCPAPSPGPHDAKAVLENRALRAWRVELGERTGRAALWRRWSRDQRSRLLSPPTGSALQPRGSGASARKTARRRAERCDVRTRTGVWLGDGNSFSVRASYATHPLLVVLI